MYSFHSRAAGVETAARPTARNAYLEGGMENSLFDEQEVGCELSRNAMINDTVLDGLSHPRTRK
jgi:hypothetical protein